MFNKTTRVCAKNSKFAIWMGRDHSGQVANIPWYGCYGNPYSVEQYGRDVAISKFKEYFDERIKTDPYFKQAVESLKGKVLGCACAEGVPCHVDVYINWLENTTV